MIDFEDRLEEEFINWEEAEWTRQVLGMSIAHFACMLGVNVSVVYHGQKHPQTLLKPQAAVLLRLGVNRLKAKV